MVRERVRDTPARSALLSAGVGLLNDRHGDVTQVKMSDVVERAGVTNGAFYHLWPQGLAAFQEDLIRYAVDPKRQQAVDGLVTDIGEVLAGAKPTMPLAELIRRFAAQNSHSLDNDKEYRVWLAMWARHFGDKGLTDKLGDSYRGVSEKFSQMYSQVLEEYGLELRPPFDTRLLAATLTALAEGAVLRRTVDPDALALPDDRDGWEIVGLAILLIAAMATRKAGSEDTRDARQVAQEMLEL